MQKTGSMSPYSRGFLRGAALLAAFAAAPAAADIKAGVDAWSQGDYTGAVREWESPAGAGDPDAMFNLGQAYRLGRGVPADLALAEDLYARAAAAGHVQAADTYGLMLFQSGRQEAALPYVRDAARRGDPRSQYLLGIAHFNGDQVERDWTRAYALLTLAAAAGLPQAAPALAEMDRQIPLDRRQRAAGLAVEMRAEADAARARDLATAELAAGEAPTAPQAVEPSPRVPQPLQTASVSPSVAAARTAVAEAPRATGTESPADAGASYAPVAEPAVAEARPRPTPAPAPPQTGGGWRLQLGAFSVPGNADRLWDRLKGRPELAGRERLTLPAGNVTRLLAGGYPSRAAAGEACRSLKAAGHDCLVTDR